MTFRRMVFYIVILVLVGIIGYSIVHKTPVVTPPAPVVTTPPAPVITSTANYSCDAAASIAASYTSNSAILKLSDGRTLTLPQIISADGAQYQEGNILFVTKGDQAFLQENGPSNTSGQVPTSTYTNCLTGTSGTTADGMKTFTDQGNTFSFSYPTGFVIAGGGIGYTEDWKKTTDGTLGLILATINVPATFEPTTNFADAKLTIGTSSDPKAVKSCLVAVSGNGTVKSATTINGIKYEKIITSDAGAGQRYETTSYRTIQNSQCYAIEYTIHSSALSNFDPATGVKAFDHAKIEAALLGIVQSLTFLTPQH
jgi:membrane-bound inhibitor of C-type lysozyme